MVNVVLVVAALERRRESESGAMRLDVSPPLPDGRDYATFMGDPNTTDKVRRASVGSRRILQQPAQRGRQIQQHWVGAETCVEAQRHGTSLG